MKNNPENILVYENLDPPSIEPTIASKRKDKWNWFYGSNLTRTIQTEQDCTLGINNQSILSIIHYVSFLLICFSGLVLFANTYTQKHIQRKLQAPQISPCKSHETLMRIHYLIPYFQRMQQLVGYFDQMSSMCYMRLYQCISNSSPSDTGS